MKQYINKSALVAEIENRIKELQNLHKENEEKLDSIQKTAILLCIEECKVILSLLDTIEVKEVDSLTDIVIEKARKWFQKSEHLDFNGIRRYSKDDFEDFENYMRGGE